MKSNDKSTEKPKIPLQSIINTLQNPTKFRSPSELAEIMEVIQHCDFFRRINKELQNLDFLKICCANMTVEEYAKGMPIYKLGDQNSSFYYILSGTVSICLPAKLINTTSIPREYIPLIRNLVKSVSDNIPIELIDPDEFIIRKLFLDFIQRDLKIIEDLSICQCRDITDKLTDGETFGISGLFTERLRSHNTIALSKTYVAVLTKSAFKKALNNYKDKKIADKLDFLHKLPLFCSWSMVTLARILDNFVSVSYFRNQKIFVEGDPADSVIFIVQGEVKLTKSSVRCTSLIEPQDLLSSSNNSSPLRLGKARKLLKSRQMQLVVKGKYQVIGMDDMCEDMKFRNYSCIVYSSRADVLILSRQVYLDRVSRADIIPYINSKKKYESLWLSERVEEIKATDRILIKTSALDDIKPKRKISLQLRNESPVTLFNNTRYNTEERAKSTKPTSRTRKKVWILGQNQRHHRILRGRLRLKDYPHLIFYCFLGKKNIVNSRRVF
ncbi:hypothetical protein SteCoe_3231 [Stentor coeruleus]|uniref:Cyclic nucleotide-binding domain-containing protein n=1 Tax=Stentor coeruleus TaxID=5963 RepID=A0A1R2CXR0_9CILI|nr:hypothetical protein SteCoe_3231 [Stentor coeruleus]